MFAKLKKKIQDEGTQENPGADSKTSLTSPSLRPIPGHASPVNRRRSEAGDISLDTSGDDQVKDSPQSTKAEEILAMLLKRTEQVKKLEAKISEYAGTIREKNRSIEQLENKYEVKEQEFSRSVQELNHKLQRATEYKKKYYSMEEQASEAVGTTALELTRLKHMLTNKEEDLAQCQRNLDDKSKTLELTITKSEKIDCEVEFLRSKVEEVETQLRSMKDKSMEKEDKIRSIEVDKLQVESDLSKRKKELSEKSSRLITVESEHTDLQGEHQTLLRNSEQFRIKMTKLIDEKSEHITHLEERIRILEQRVNDGDLSGDERVKALENERGQLEDKLSEARQQLTEVKSSWSDKINHLEQQISNLNAKIVEDNEELLNCHKCLESQRETLQKQLSSLTARNEELLKQIDANTGQLKDQDLLLQRQSSELDTTILKHHQDLSNLELNLRSKITSLESQVLSLEQAREHEKSTIQDKLNKLESSNDEHLEKEIESEKQITNLEDEVQRLKAQVGQSNKEYHGLKKQHDLILQEKVHLFDKISSLEKEAETTSDKIVSVQNAVKSKQTQLQESNKEKDRLLLRNAELSQHVELMRKGSKEESELLRSHLLDKEAEVTQLKYTVNEVQEQHKACDQKMSDIQNSLQSSMSNIESERIEFLQNNVSTLEEQVNDKDKKIKMQQARLTDLKKTLQRELKVQSLPGDSVYLSDSDSGSKSQQIRTEHQKHVRGASNGDINGVNYTRTASGESAIAKTHNIVPPFQETVTKQQHKGNHLMEQTAHNLRQQSRERENKTLGEIHELDINLEYLKHVVLKFILSQEAEAIHLVRALAVMLKYSEEEQKLIKRTLEYRMSWWGSKPNLGKGQKKKYIPPTA